MTVLQRDEGLHGDVDAEQTGTLVISTSTANGPAGVAEHRSSASILAHFIGAFYGVTTMLRGCEWFARSTWPVALGVSTDSDRSYPDVGGVIGSAIAVLAGIALVAVLIASAKGSVAARRGAGAVLIGMGLLLATYAASDDNDRRCVRDSYTEAHVCTSRLRSAIRDGLLWGLPAVAAGAGVLHHSGRSTRHRADSDDNAPDAV